MNGNIGTILTNLGLLLVALPALAGPALGLGGASRNPVSPEAAAKVAVNQLTRARIAEARKIRDPKELQTRMWQILAEPPSVQEVFTESKEGTPVYHILNLKPQGWVAVAADKVAYPIIGFSGKGAYIPGRKNCGFQAWMENVRDEIHAAASRDLPPLPRASAAWDELDQSPDTFLAREASFAATVPAPAVAGSVWPLLTSTWGQGSNWPGIEPCASWLIAWLIGYDAYCPYEKNWAGFYQVAPTGCVATAAGQIMKFWSWPPSGEGSHTSDPPYVPLSGACISESTYGPYTVDYAARTYNWAIMPDDVIPLPSGLVPGSTYEVAKLLRDVGNALDMNYAPGGSSTSTSYVPEVLENHFRYSRSAAYLDRASYDSATWIDMLKNELTAGRPVQYRGESALSGGHSFVIDGYDVFGNFHVNWGWEGLLDWWFSIDFLTSLGGDFNNGQAGVFYIKPDYPPTAANDAYSMNEDSSLSVPAAGVLANDSDPWGDPLSAGVDTWPSSGSLSLNANGSFTYTPSLHFVGTDTFTYHASDGRYSSGSATVTITVNAVNHAPVLSPIGAKTVDEGQLLQFAVSATDRDNNPLTYTATNLPAGASFDPASRILTWTPSFTQAGTYPNVLFQVQDNQTPALQASEAITITVNNVNRAPVLSPIGGKSVNEGQLLQFFVSATDPDGDGLSYSASNLPAGASFNPATRIFSWRPTYSQGGIYPNVGFTVTDTGSPSLSTSEAITISVTNVILDTYGQDDEGRARVCFNSRTGDFKWEVLSGPHAGEMFSGVAMLRTMLGKTYLSTAPGSPVNINLTVDLASGTARGVLVGGAGCFHQLSDSNLSNNGPSPCRN
ncbi:MAG: C10 family peptidase [Acidobacteria bacterium]|nr:C10 family peptidase [Acidobacteriota bacterium]